MKITSNISTTSVIQIKENRLSKTKILAVDNLYRGEFNFAKYEFVLSHYYRQSYIKYVPSQKMFNYVSLYWIQDLKIYQVITQREQEQFRQVNELKK